MERSTAVKGSPLNKKWALARSNPNHSVFAVHGEENFGQDWGGFHDTEIVSFVMILPDDSLSFRSEVNGKNQAREE